MFLKFAVILFFVFALSVPFEQAYAVTPIPLTTGVQCRQQDGSPLVDPTTNQIQDCDPNPVLPSNMGLVCLPSNGNINWTCQTGTTTSGVFGFIHPPVPLWTIPYGAPGISQILSKVVAIIYSIAAIVVIFMFVFGAFEWILSAGDKEKVSSAQSRITSAIIGLVLLAILFPVLKVLGRVTGFSFF